MAGGRPNKYDSQIKPYIKQLGILRSNGMQYSDMAKFMNIAESTLYKHKAAIEEFTEAIKKGTDILVDELEATLYDLAKGNVIRKKTKISYDSEGKPTYKEETTEQLAPNVAALIFSLTNLAPDRWSNNQNVNLESNDEIAPSFSKVVRGKYEADTK